MQLTRLDRWLRERFVHETHFFTLRPLEDPPAGVIARDLPDAPGRTYRHQLIAQRPDLARKVVAALKHNNQMFATRVVDRSAWYVPLIAPHEASLVFRVLWAAIAAATVWAAVTGLRALWANDELRRHVIEAFEIFKG